MSHQNFFEYQPTKDLNRLLREYGQACLSDTLPAAPSGFTNIIWQTDMKGNISANVPTSSGGGGVNPGTITQLPFYQTTGAQVSPSNVTSNGNSLTVPTLLTSGQSITSGGQTSASGSIGSGINYVQSSIFANVLGPGYSLGNAGGWSTAFLDVAQLEVSRRGITQLRSGRIDKHAVGDTAGLYHYTFTDGGSTANSDEGSVGITAQCIENTGYFHGTVSSSTQTGGTPTLAFSSGNNWTTDGAYLLNITKGTISGSLDGFSAVTNMDIGSGAASTFLNSLPVTGVTLPISSAIGIVQGGISDELVTADSPIPVTVTVDLVRIGGTFHSFSVGNVVTVAGLNYPEQSVITAASTPTPVGSTEQQTLTLNLRNPNTQAIIFAGGIQGQYISFDANLAFSGMRSSYFAFGSLTGTDLIYGFNIGGNLVGNLLPMIGYEAATASGSSAGFHLYPGAEIVANTDAGFACKVEQNGVTWSNGDIVENPHNPAQQNGGGFFTLTQNSPSNSAVQAGAFSMDLLGTGIGGLGTTGIRVNNLNPPTYYLNHGGPLVAPHGISLNGNYTHLLDCQVAPEPNGYVVNVQSPNGSDAQVRMLSVNFAGGGNVVFDIPDQRWLIGNAIETTNYWVFDAVHSTTLQGATGTFTSADSKTVTVTNGIVTSIV